MRVLYVGRAGHETLVPALESAGATVGATTDGADAVRRAESAALDCVLVDDTAERRRTLLRRLPDEPPVVFVSTGDAAAVNAASAAGVDAVVAVDEGEDAGVADAVDVVERVVADAAFDAGAARGRHLEALVGRAVREDVTPETVCEWLAAEYGAAWTARVDGDALRPETGVGVAASALAVHSLPDGLVDPGDVATTDDGVTAVGVGDGRALCLAAILSDGERRALAPLGHVLARARVDEDAVTTFAGAFGHELKNGLQTAHTYLDLAVETGDSDHVESARDALSRLDRLADDATALAADTALDPTDVSVADAARDAWKRTDAPDASLAVEADVVVTADPGLLDLLLENLLRNSFEHGNATTVTVGPLDDGAGFYVADDGPGIPEEERERVFEWGYTTGGSGVGLPLVRRVAERHDWTVSVTESETGGARFETTT